MIFALLLYFRNMPTGLDALLHYSSTSETCQLDLMIFCATPLLQEHANWTWWSLRYSSTSGTCQLDLMIFALLLYFRNMPTGLGDLCATPLLQEHANWTWWSLRYSSTSGTCQLDLMIFALLLYFRNMPTGLDALLHYSSTSGTCQLDLMIFALLLYFRNMPTGLDDLVHYSSTSGTCQLDLMIFALLLYLRNMPTERNDLLHYSSTSGTCQLDLMIFGANENVCVRNSEFPPWNVLWSFEISMFGIRRKLPELPGQPLLLFTSLKRCRLSWWSITASCCWQGHSSIRKVDSYAKRCQSDSIRLVPNFRRTKTGG